MDKILWNEASEIVKILKNNGFIAFFAGGVVRDLFLGRQTCDIDIATEAQPKQIKEIFPSAKLVGADFGVTIVRNRKYKFEIATFRKDKEYSDGRHPSSIEFSTPQEDAQRRDFTVNGMFFDPIEQKIYDYVEGKQDLIDCVLRAIGEPEMRFNEDYLRMLRAIRFAAKLNFRIEGKTWQAIKQNAEKITKIAKERINDELTNIFLGDYPEKALEMLENSGMLKHILPEISVMKGIPQPENFHPEGDVFEHTKLLLKHMNRDSQNISQGLAEPGAMKPTKTLAWGVLLHDVGKPSTFEMRDRARFNNHANAGADIAFEILKRLKFSKAQHELICALVKNHMRFMDSQKMKPSTLKRLLQLDNFKEHLALHRLDCLGSNGDLGNVHYILKKIEEFGKENINPQPLITGKQIISLGFSAGPIIGKIKQNIVNKQLDGKLKTYDQAVAYIKKHYKSSTL